MISPNLHAIWVFLLAILSQDFKARSFDIFWDLGRRLIHCRAVKISLSGTTLLSGETELYSLIFSLTTRNGCMVQSQIDGQQRSGQGCLME
jgi:hypothetical protein